jgi:ABC-2 type transport system permease protein
VADVTRPAGIAKQILLVAQLRWRLLHNNLRRKQNRLDLLGLIIIGVLAGAVVIGVSIALFVGAYDFVSTDKIGWLSLFFWAIFLWWQLFPIMAAGFGASFEFRGLLRFPLRLSAFYLIGLAYGLADFSGVAGTVWLLSIVTGTVSARPALLFPMLVVAALFLLFNVTLERLVGSWLERLLARRRSREFFFAGFILLMVSLQLLGPLMSRYGNSAVPMIERLLPYFAPLPPTLAGSAIAAAAAGKTGTLGLGVAGLCLYVLALSGLLWLRFAAQYRGEELSETPRASRPAARASSAREMKTDALRLLSPQVAAVVRKEVRYLTRNGFAALLLFVPPILVFGLISQATVLAGFKKGIPAEAFFPGLVAYIILILMAPAYNSFAYENTGIQTYFTAPVAFRDVLLGKNAVHVSLIAAELALCIAAFSYRVGLPSPPVFVATLVAIVFTVVGQLSIANWSSLSFPRKLAFGQVHGQRQSGMAVLTAFGAQLLLFSIGSLVLMLGRWTGDRWLPAKTFALLAAAAAGGYLASLDALTGYAEKKKEKLIEALCR